MTKRDRYGYILRHSNELAMTGKISGHQAIEFHMVYEEGLEETRAILDSRGKRAWLDILCAQAQGATVSPPST